MKIIGATVGTSLPKPNFDQTDPKKGDYIKGDRSFLRVDDTLTESGISADAKVTGDAINNLQANIDQVSDLVGTTPVADQITEAIANKAEVNHNHSALEHAIDAKVDKVDGMGLSSNDYTDEEKTKLAHVTEDVARKTEVQIIIWEADD